MWQPGSRGEAADLPALKARAWDEFCRIEGVEGIGLGEHRIRVYVRNSKVGRQLPTSYHGVPIDIVIVGQIVLA